LRTAAFRAFTDTRLSAAGCPLGLLRRGGGPGMAEAGITLREAAEAFELNLERGAGRGCANDAVEAWIALLGRLQSSMMSSGPFAICCRQGAAVPIAETRRPVMPEAVIPCSLRRSPEGVDNAEAGLLEIAAGFA
jgi:hypothetical protein